MTLQDLIDELNGLPESVKRCDYEKNTMETIKTRNGNSVRVEFLGEFLGREIEIEAVERKRIEASK